MESRLNSDHLRTLLSSHHPKLKSGQITVATFLKQHDGKDYKVYLDEAYEALAVVQTLSSESFFFSTESL